ncbi:MAG: hypothetical protein P8I13_00135 [Porticoccaceae bacterium]|nr:hypothetical protein [Porticoccaceae bacterium]
MSYILNALKKAEQDRLRDDPKDLEDFASARWDPYEQKPASNKTAIVLVFISLAILGLVLVIYQGSFKPLAQKVEIVSDNPQPANIVEPLVDELKPRVDPEAFALPVLEISGHMYFAQGSESNRLFANDQSFKEGDLIANGWQLTAIGIDGIKMEKQSRSVFIAYP